MIFTFFFFFLNISALCGGPGSIAFAIDGSDSIRRSDFARMIEFTIKNIDSFELGNDRIRVGALVYSNTISSNGFFSLTTDRTDIETQIKSFVQPKQGTRTDLAIKKLGEILQNGDTKVGVVITDGESLNSNQTIIEAEKLRDAGVTIIAVGIGSLVNKVELKGIAGSNSLAKTISFSDLTSVTTLAEINRLLCQGKFMVKDKYIYSHTFPCGHLYKAVTCTKRPPFSCPVIEIFI